MQPDHNDVRTILIVDDFEDIRAAMKIWLKRLGYRVIEARDGDLAIIVARLEHPDLILMDLGMPLRSGISATYKIRDDPELSGIPIVALTAYESEDLRKEALEAGCVEYLTKPIDTNELEKVLNDLLPRS